MMFKVFVLAVASLSFLTHASADETITVAEILSALDSTRMDHVSVEFTLFEKITGEPPAEVAEMMAQIPQDRAPESACVLIYDRQRGARFTNLTQGSAHNVLNNLEVALEANKFPSDGAWNVTHTANQRAAWDRPVVYSFAPVQMIMLWLDPLSTALFKDLDKQSEFSVPIINDPVHGQVVSIEIPEQKSRLLLSKSHRWRPVVVEKFRNNSLTTFKYSVNGDGTLVADSIQTDRDTPSGRDATYRLTVDSFVVREITDSDIEIAYPAYTLLEVEDESGGMRQFVTSSSGKMRELAPGQSRELDSTRGWRTFADGENRKSSLVWYAFALVGAISFAVLLVWKRR